MLSSFTHPQVVPNLYECICFAEHKGKYLEESGKFWGTIDFHCIVFPTMEVNGDPKQPGYKLSSKYIPLAMPIAQACSYPYLRLFFCHAYLKQDSRAEVKG